MAQLGTAARPVRAAGAAQGRPRVKLTTVSEVLEVIHSVR